MVEAFKQRKAENTESIEIPKDTGHLLPLGVELFLVGTAETTSLPFEIAHNPVVVEQSAKRRVLYTQLSTIFEKVPDVTLDIDTAMDKSLLNETDVAGFYTNLSDFLNADENHARIVLYLPSQILPDMHKSDSDVLAAAKKTFSASYKTAWKALLYESDVRAGFVDGDVGEPGMDEPSRVRKAAHLVPDALAKGIFTIDEIHEVLEKTDEEEIAQSLQEGLIVASDRSLIEATEEVERELPVSFVIQPEVSRYTALKRIAEKFENALAAIEKKYSPESSYSKTVSKKRVVWEKGVKKEEAINKTAEQLTAWYSKEKITIDDIQRFMRKTGYDEAFAQAGLQSIFHIGEKLVSKEGIHAQRVVAQSWSILEEYSKSEKISIRDTLTGGLSHWEKLGLVTSQDMEKLGMHAVDLSQPLPIDTDKLIHEDLGTMSQDIAAITNDPELSSYVFPFFLTFGSRVKGYAKSGADMDFGIFFKPGTPWEKREEIFTRLQEKVSGLPDRYEVPQFWIDQKNGTYTFRSVPDESEVAVISGPQLIHFIFGSVWVGETKEAKKLAGDLAGKYLNLERFGEQKDAVRFQFLRRLEMDFLQYRLMHKGYGWLYPNRRSEGTIHANMIDWESNFWDPGYRRVATQVFFSRVFLPDLSKEK